MDRDRIIEVLKKAEGGLTMKELSDKINEPVSGLRGNLFRLQEEGKVESLQKEDKLRWTIKSDKPSEKRYEKMRKKPFA